MNELQIGFVVVFTCVAAVGFVKGCLESRKKNALGLTYLLRPFGAFVWADMVIFGAFWILAGLLSLFFADWVLFLLIVSLFWLVRSVGETMYWFQQQFSPIKRNPPEKMIIYRFFRNDSVWFVYQIFWQCLTVFFIITSLYVGKVWLSAF